MRTDGVARQVMKTALARICPFLLAMAGAAHGGVRADQAVEPSVAEAPAKENSFIRFVEDETSGRLQTAVTTYENAGGVKVELVRIESNRGT